MPWPAEDTTEGGSEYRDRFRQGAILVPRRFALVNRVKVGKLTPSKTAPTVQGRTGKLDKKPWTEVTPPTGQVEAEFIMPTLLGENVAPYRILDSVEAVVPWHKSFDGIMSSKEARARGFNKLAAWLSGIEKTFDSVREAGGKGDRTFAEQLDYIGQLSSQFPLKAIRVVYAKSGTLPAATIVEGDFVIDHKLYWATAATREEAAYLAAILNSETVRARAEHWQAEGMFGAQDFDKGAWNLPIPLFNRKDPIHRELAAKAAIAETVAAAVLHEDEGFQRFRRKIREALIADGVGARIESLVDQLLAVAVAEV